MCVCFVCMEWGKWEGEKKGIFESVLRAYSHASSTERQFLVTVVFLIEW